MTDEQKLAVTALYTAFAGTFFWTATAALVTGAHDWVLAACCLMVFNPLARYFQQRVVR
jgi:hypothetical protein